MNEKEVAVFSLKVYPEYNSSEEWGWYFTIPEESHVIDFVLPSSDEDYLLVYYYQEI